MSAHALVKNVLKIEDEPPNFEERERCDTHPHFEHTFVLFNLFTAFLHRRCSSSHHRERGIQRGG